MAVREAETLTENERLIQIVPKMGVLTLKQPKFN